MVLNHVIFFFLIYLIITLSFIIILFIINHYYLDILKPDNLIIKLFFSVNFDDVIIY